ncbi:hypothetical protein VTO42DRAFT_8525 [Malbranchea cinnamomea]
MEQSSGPSQRMDCRKSRANAFIVASGVLTVFPGLLTGPVYSLLGFTPLGPQAGSLAASIQSSIGNVASRSLFAHLQSAAMSGYGGATVNAAVRLAASGGYLTARVAGRFLRW